MHALTEQRQWRVHARLYWEHLTASEQGAYLERKKPSTKVAFPSTIEKNLTKIAGFAMIR